MYLSFSNKRLRKQLIKDNVQIGMVEFNNKKDILPIPNKFLKVGNFELDILAIEKSNGQVVLIDHDQPNFVMGQVALNLKCMTNALAPIEHFFTLIETEEDLFDDEIAMKKIALESSNLAGGKDYQWFYDMIFGI